MTERRPSKILRVSVGGAAFGVLLGSLLHFTYQGSGRLTVVALFSAVNESPWEHLKLYFFPIVLYIAVEWFLVPNKAALLFAKLVQIVAGMVFIEAFFYTYTGALGIESVWVDIFSFVVAMASGYALSYRLVANGVTGRFPAWLSAASIALVMLFFITTTFAPPHLPLFRDSNTGTYGVH
jgi:hypothetical protein